mgnify:FL=1|tara:strand:+ start:184 stop:1110 length:927 start_codon:yes stop_codon:yes gene_type:complete
MTQFYVKDGGSFREVSEFFFRDGTSFTNKTITNVYVKDGGDWREVFQLFTATSFQNLSDGQTLAVPALANAIHIKNAVAGGGGSMNGLGYDKAGGEQGGRGGGSGAFISDKVFAVTGGETLTATIGSGGGSGSSAGFNYTGSAGVGGNTSLSGSSSNQLFLLTGGSGSSFANGGVQGPIATQTSGSAGTATINATAITTFTTTGGLTQGDSSFAQGRAGSFNSSGNGAQGFPQTGPSTAPFCGGDNCSIGGADGAPSYNGQVTGGAAGGNLQNGTAGTFGAGAGGGGKERSGASGGDGEITVRFLRTI